MTSSVKVLYVNVFTFDDTGAVVKNDYGERERVRGPGMFDSIEDGRFCCLARVLEEAAPRFRVQFRSGEVLWVRDERPRFYDERRDAMAF